MIRLLTPDSIAERVEDISLDALADSGTLGIALDLDNTIVPWHTTDLSTAKRAWVAQALERGFRVCVVTNSYAGYALQVARELGVPLVAGALKPVPLAFERALKAMTLPAASCVVIGDQLFTDVFGGKLLGMRAILVKPIGGREFFTTRFMRMMERPLLARMRQTS
ncbi:MAG TPA: YqeG family HAD IIIA-type phosphatase [Candidatus Binatus sp.]|nr:YqeG family HAD IIIA-type phosphatase [Candidatus Binatus sp.]